LGVFGLFKNFALGTLGVLAAFVGFLAIKFKTRCLRFWLDKNRPALKRPLRFCQYGQALGGGFAESFF
jgi:hypothetical protein